MRKLIFDEKTGKVYAEPRYSVAELEKIEQYMIEKELIYPSSKESFITTILKDKKKVQEALR